MTNRMSSESGMRVLVVDDDALLRTLLRTTLEHTHVTIEEAANIQAAAAAIERELPDVIVLDVDMPGGDGLSFARLLQQDAATARIGIVLLTGTTLTEEEGLAAGVSSVLRKPFSPLDLLAATERAAGRPGTRLISDAGSRPADQLLVYAEDVRRLLDIERRQRSALERSYAETLGALAMALESRDAGTGAHSARVQRYAIELTRAIAPALADDPSVAFGYLLHDIGKIGIPDSVLLKAGPLSRAERTIMQTHAPLGAEIVSRVVLLQGHGIDVVRHHHERWDGTGYPDRLAGDAIPLPARIFAVADALDAITSVRPYRTAQPWQVAVEELDAGTGSQFDPAVVRAFHAQADTLRALSAAA